MARTKEEGLKWFPLDVTFFSNRKVKILKSRFGSDGITIYLYLLCEMYGNKGYYIELNEDYVFLMSDDLNMSDDKIRQILKFLYERSLLVELKVDKSSKLFMSDTIITAEGIQEQYQTSTKLLKRDVEVIKDLWVLPEDKTLGHIKFALHEISPRKKIINPRNKPINPRSNAQRKEKKIKENKSKEKDIGGASADEYFENNEVNVLFKEFLELRKKLKCKNTEHAIKLLINKLNHYHDNVKKKALEDAIMNSWKSVYPENGKYNKQDSKKSETGNQFLDILESGVLDE